MSTDRTEFEVVISCYDPILLIESDEVDMMIAPSYSGAYQCILNAIGPYLIEHTKKSVSTYRLILQPTMIMTHRVVPGIDGEMIFVPRTLRVKVNGADYVDDGMKIKHTVYVDIEYLDGEKIDIVKVPTYNPFTDYSNLFGMMNTRR